MSPKTGRPKKENPRNYKINIRLTKGELDDIQYIANRLNTSRTNAIVEAVKQFKDRLLEQ